MPITCQNRLEQKLDLLIEMVAQIDGIKGFGLNLLANVLGDCIVRR